MNKRSVSVSDDSLRKRSQWRDVWKRLRRNKLAMIGMVLVILIVFSAIFADLISPYPYDGIDVTARLQLPSAEHLLGTDNFGRDLLSRIIYGGRISLLVACAAVLIALVIGGVLGATAGFFGGTYETIVMAFMDILMAIPGFLLAVAISTALGGGTLNTSLAIAVGAIPSYARLVRSQVLTIKDREFVEAAEAMGAGKLRIIFHDIVPNALSPIIVESTLRIGACILQISSLSFIGLGVQPPTPEWGSMISAGRQYIRDFYPIVVCPGLAIMVTLIAFNLLGDGLRDALDPRLKQ